MLTLTEKLSLIFEHMWEFRLYGMPALPGGDAGMFPAARPRPVLDAEYTVWLDFLAANQPLEDDPAYFEPYVWEVEKSEDAGQFAWALSNLQSAIAKWQEGE